MISSGDRDFYAEAIVPKRKNGKKLKRLINSNQTANTSFDCGLPISGFRPPLSTLSAINR
jgi:hypothetical protein